MIGLITVSLIVFEHSWKAALLIAALFLVRFVIGKKIPPAWRFGLWFLVAVPLVFHFALPASWSVFNWVPTGSRLVGLAASIDSSCSVSADCLVWKATFVQKYHWMYPWMLLFSSFWLAGCAVMSIVFLRQIMACRLWIRQAEPITHQRARLIFEDSCRRMNVKTRLLVAESPAISGPFLVGAVRPTLLLPQGMAESVSDNHLRTIFLHELAHLKRRDVWTSWLMSFFLVAHWFNPLLWAAIRRMNADREEACDAMALRTLSKSERVDYGRALLDIAEHFLVPRKTPGLVGLAETLDQMSGRIEMVRKTGTWKRRWKFAAAVLFTLLALTMITDAPAGNRSLPKPDGGPARCNAERCLPKTCPPAPHRTCNAADCQ